MVVTYESNFTRGFGVRLIGLLTGICYGRNPHQRHLYYFLRACTLLEGAENNRNSCIPQVYHLSIVDIG